MHQHHIGSRDMHLFSEHGVNIINSALMMGILILSVWGYSLDFESQPLKNFSFWHFRCNDYIFPRLCSLFDLNILPCVLHVYLFFTLYIFTGRPLHHLQQLWACSKNRYLQEEWCPSDGWISFFHRCYLTTNLIVDYHTIVVAVVFIGGLSVWNSCCTNLF